MDAAEGKFSENAQDNINQNMFNLKYSHNSQGTIFNLHYTHVIIMYFLR